MILGIPKPVALIYSANGTKRLKSDYLALPLDKNALSKAAIEAKEAGASVFSFSVRDEKGRPEQEPERCAEAVSSIKSAVKGELHLQLELDLAPEGAVAQAEKILSASRPDSCLLEFQKLFPRNGDEKDEELAQNLLDECETLQIGVQFAMADPADIEWFCAFRNYGVIPQANQSLLFILGQDGETPQSDPRDIRKYLLGLDKQYLLERIKWSVAAFGPQEKSALAAAISLGGHIAPGWAYNIHATDGEEITSPNQHIADLREIAERLGRPLANAFAAQTILFG